MIGGSLHVTYIIQFLLLDNII